MNTLLTLQDLPMDCLQVILDLLKQRAALNFISTCVQFYKLKFKRLRTNKQIDWAVYPYVEVIHGMTQEYNNLRMLRKLKIIEPILGDHKLNISFLPNLEILKINSIVTDVSIFPKLRSLKCSGMPIGISKIPLVKLNLYLNDVRDIRLIEKSSTVRKLTLEETRFNKDEFKINSFYPSVKHLKLRGDYSMGLNLDNLNLTSLSIGCDSCNSSFSHLTMIEKLDLFSFHQCNGLVGFTNLRSLELHASGIYDGVLMTMTKLTKLVNLYSSEQDLPLSLKKLKCSYAPDNIYQLTSLTSLYTYGDHFTGEWLQPMMSRLKVLSISKCDLDLLESDTLEELNTFKVDLKKLVAPRLRQLEIDMESKIDQLVTDRLDTVIIHFDTYAQESHNYNIMINELIEKVRRFVIFKVRKIHIRRNNSFNIIETKEKVNSSIKGGTKILYEVSNGRKFRKFRKI